MAYQRNRPSICRRRISNGCGSMWPPGPRLTRVPEHIPSAMLGSSACDGRGIPLRPSSNWN